ncbi:hypothetical protein [Streptomyces collinus]|uniref:hypothetical protein n=1 Tax=Streptomyces collinus TaxID=42684 RepID=UPI003409DC4F
MGQARDIHQDTDPMVAMPTELSEALSTVRELVTRVVDERLHAVPTAFGEMERRYASTSAAVVRGRAGRPGRGVVRRTGRRPGGPRSWRRRTSRRSRSHR